MTRLRSLKVLLASIILLCTGALFIALGKHIDAHSILSWIPFQEFGGILIGASLLGIWLDQYFRREEQASRDLQLRAILRDQAPEMRDAVLGAFAANR